MKDEATNGYVERKDKGAFEGTIKVWGVDLSPIQGVMFQENGKTYLWLKRKDKLVYDPETQQYNTKKREPRWEAYLEKHFDNNNVIAFKGEFYFMRFRFSIVGIWDSVLGMQKNRLNLFVERLPMEKQDIINKINERKSNEKQP